MSVDICCVNPNDIEKIWPQAKNLIRAAIERTGLSEFADIERDVLAGDQLLWLAISDRVEMATTTHLVKTRDRVVCIITACSSYQRDHWLNVLGLIEKYAKDEGAACVRLYGRKGWERALAGHGYRVEHIQLEKALG